MAMIFVMSSQSTVPRLPVAVSDKTLHGVLYCGLGALLVRALASGRLAAVSVLVCVAAAALATAYGVTDEVHQLFVFGRECDVRDLAADAVGAAVGAGAIGAWSIIRRFSGRSERHC